MWGGDTIATATQHPPLKNVCEDLIRQMEVLRFEIQQQSILHSAKLEELPEARRGSAENLLHYLALRNCDLRALQDQLSRLGLSSLGRLEPHVLPTINLVLSNLYLLSGQDPPDIDLELTRSAFESSVDLLEWNTELLFGPHPQKRRVYIMVTMPTEAASNYLIVHQLLKSGMNCMRINCSKDDQSSWVGMIEHLKNARSATGNNCRTLMDLGGPKLRTGAMQSVPAVLKIRPVRTRDGQITRPARIWLAPKDGALIAMDAADANLTVARDWLEKVSKGDRVRLRDTRGAKRVWQIVDVTANGCWAEASKTVYLANGTVLRLHGTSGVHRTEVSDLPEQQTGLCVRNGDILFLSVEDEPGKPSTHDETGEQLNPGCISLPIPEIYRDARQGESVFFDDGRIAGLIENVTASQLKLRITHTHKEVEKLTGDRGINLPDTKLDLPALSDKDLDDLEFVAKHADMVGLSFTNCAADVKALRQRLVDLGREDMGIVVKIETKRGFSNLSEIIFEALKFPACGVMIARGDLAVECGFERMAELQEEILWICESAHVPVIWATQVLENLTQKGFASRAEITDAAMSQSAEAVMLNKGPHIVESVCTLDNILQRMQGHHNKKRSVMRKLALASAFKYLGSE